MKLLTATITREKLYKRRARFQWSWIYAIDGTTYGEHLASCRDYAASIADRVVESWEGGKVWEKGPRGGLRQVQP